MYLTVIVTSYLADDDDFTYKIYGQLTEYALRSEI